MLNRKNLNENCNNTTIFNEDIKRNLFNYLMIGQASQARLLNSTTQNPELHKLQTKNNVAYANQPLLKPTVSLDQIANKDIVLRYTNPEKIKNTRLSQPVSSYFFNKDNKIMNSLSLFVGTNDLALPIDKSKIDFANLPLARLKKWYLIEDLQKILVTYFKSMYSLISKAKFKVFAEKINVEILYYITIPDANIFTWYMIFNQKAVNNLNPGLASLINSNDRKKSKKIEFLKRKNKLIKLLINKTKNIRKKERFFQLNLKSINYLYESKFNSLVRFFNSLFQKPIEFLLIRLHHSDADSNILAQLVLLVLKKKNIRRIINKLYNKNKVKDINKMKFSINSQKLSYNEASKFIPVYLSGLYIHIGGRLMREPIIPRRTTKKFEKGAIAVGKVNSLEETSITKKNRKGAYTIKIIFAQNLMSNA